MKRKKSFVRAIFSYLLIVMILIILILGLFLGSSFHVLKNEIYTSSDSFLDIYENELENDIAKMDSIFKNITTQGEDLAKIKSNQENERALSAISLHSYITFLLTNNELEGAIFVYDNNYDVCLNAISSNVKYNQKNNLRAYTKEALTNLEISSFTWDVDKIGENVYLYKMIVTKDRVIAVYVETKQLFSELISKEKGKDKGKGKEKGSRTFVLTKSDGTIGKVWGEETEGLELSQSIRNFNDSQYYVRQRNVAQDQLAIYCYSNKSVILNQTHIGMIMLGIAVAITVLFMVFLLVYTRREILLPMKHLIFGMNHIKEGNYETRIEDKYHTSEFCLLQETLNQMVDEIVGLKIQSYEKKIELQEVELRSIRLQLKPHFFLNALTTISSLSRSNKNAQITEYIDTLSRNVRYMFKAGMHTVTVKEEIKHVENYIEMQELKYPNCVFYLIDLPKELEGWRIPQMLIHTFIENEYKYAVSIDNMLTILIKVQCVVYQSEEMLLIEIEDDGKGYPQSVIEYMSSNETNWSEDGTRMGLLSIKRMLELMYEQNGLVILENITPHGCMNRIYIPKKPKHEL